MSVARKCDRCGTYHDGRIFNVTVTDFTCLLDVTDKSYDICPDCISDLDKFLKGDKPESLAVRLKKKLTKE